MAEADQSGVCSVFKLKSEYSMERYSNLRGNSPVIGYEIQASRIIVWFKGNKPYSYSYASAGQMNVETMKELARRGAGLSAFITRNVRDNYER